MRYYLYASEIVDLLERTLGECDEILAELEKTESAYHVLGRKMKSMIPSYLSYAAVDQPVSCNEVKYIFQEIEGEARRAADRLYRHSNSAVAMELYDSRAEAERDIYNAIDKGVSGIEAHIEKNAIYIKTPLLYSRNRTKSNDLFLSHSIQAYADGVSRAIAADPRYAAFDRTPYCRKTLFYLFALDGKSPHIDNDNYDTTAVTNQIVSHLFGGDSPLTCRMVYDSVKTGELTSGTYITVLPEGQSLPENREIIEYWRGVP